MISICTERDTKKGLLYFGIIKNCPGKPPITFHLRKVDWMHTSTWSAKMHKTGVKWFLCSAYTAGNRNERFTQFYKQLHSSKNVNELFVLFFILCIYAKSYPCLVFDFWSMPLLFSAANLTTLLCYLWNGFSLDLLRHYQFHTAFEMVQRLFQRLSKSADLVLYLCQRK